MLVDNCAYAIFMCVDEVGTSCALYAHVHVRNA